MSKMIKLLTICIIAIGTLTGLSAQQQRIGPTVGAPPLTDADQPPIETVVSAKDGSFLVYNVADRGIVALFGTYEYASPVTGDVHTVEWEKFLVSPLVQPICPLEPGGSIRFHATVDPSGKGYVQRRNVTCTGALFDSGQTWGTRGPYLRARFSSLVHEMYVQLLEVKEQLDRCDYEAAATLLRSPDPIVHQGNAALLQATLQRLLFEPGGTTEKLSMDYKERIDELIRTLNGFVVDE